MEKPKLKAIAVSVLVFAASSVGPAFAAKSQMTDRDKARHLLNRVAYGPSRNDIDKLLSIGVDDYLSQQLNPKSINEPKQLQLMVSKSATMTMTPAQLFMRFGKPQMMMLAGLKGKGKKAVNTPEMRAKREEVQKKFRMARQNMYKEITDARIMRAVYSPRQLNEVMTEFWFNHFNVTFDKGLDHLWIGSYEQQAIRPHVFGKFRNLLDSTSKHAAMLFYLDNWQNTTEKAAFRYNKRGKKVKKKKRGKFSGINENYARELMELHTLGVDGGYTQDDVIALAKILTGHGLQNRRSLRMTGVGLESPSGYFFDKRRHDFSDKKFLGRIIKGSGASELDEALTILSKHPSTAKHISFKLAQFFVSDKPPESLVKRLSKKFLATDGDIREVMSTLLDSDEFWDSENFGVKYKTPYRYVVSSLRLTDSVVKKSRPLTGFLYMQGMPLYKCQTPDGYKNTQDAWLHPHGLIQRIEFATALGSGRHRAAKPRETNITRLMDRAGIAKTSKTGNVVREAPNRLKLALIVGSPEFMKH